METHQLLEKDERMTDNTPNCLVRIKYSFVANMDESPNHREEAWLNGVLFDCQNSKRLVVGVRTSQSILEDPKLLNICGIAESTGYSRKSDFKHFFIDLDSVLVVQKDKGKSKGFDLLLTKISDDEHPGWRSKTGKLIVARPVILPDYRVWTSSKDRILPEGSYSVLGVRQTLTALELVNVRASVKASRTYHEGAVLEFEKGVVGQVNFEGSPIFDGMGHLVALGLFAGRLKSGGDGLVGMSVKHLAATYGHLIESIF